MLVVCVLGRISISVAGQIQDPPNCLSSNTPVDCTVTCTGHTGCSSNVFLRKENTGRLKLICKDGGYACNTLQVEMPGHCGGQCGGKRVFACCDGKTNGEHNCNAVHFGPDVQYQCRNGGCNSVSGGRETNTACSVDLTPTTTTAPDCEPYTGPALSPGELAKWCNVEGNEESCLCDNGDDNDNDDNNNNNTISTTSTSTLAITTTIANTTTSVAAPDCEPFTGAAKSPAAQGKWCNVQANKASCLCNPPTVQTLFTIANTTGCSEELTDALATSVVQNTDATSATGTCTATANQERRRRLVADKVEVAIESLYASVEAATAATETTNTVGFIDKVRPHLEANFPHVKVDAVVSTVIIKTTTTVPTTTTLPAPAAVSDIGVRGACVHMLLSLGVCVGLLELL